jgi:hypothetical protein
LRAVDHPRIQTTLEIALLNRTQVAVEDHQRRLMRLDLGANFVDFAAADNGGRVDRLAHLQHAATDDGTSAAGKLRQFIERFAGRGARVLSGDAGRSLQAQANQQNSFIGFSRAGSCTLHKYGTTGVGIKLRVTREKRRREKARRRRGNSQDHYTP